MNATVLVVEDERELQDAYRFILESRGIHVLTANNGYEGLLLLKKNTPDVVLLDLFMPVMDGKEFMRNINASDYPDTKIVINTNHSDDSVQKELLDLGAHEFLLKSSMGPMDLIAVIKRIIANRN